MEIEFSLDSEENSFKIPVLAEPENKSTELDCSNCGKHKMKFYNNSFNKINFYN